MDILENLQSVFEDKHKLIGLLGIVLLVLYIILAAFSGPFKAIIGRAVAMLGGLFKDFAMAYSLIPIYFNWITSDYFQERKKTSLGNAATNGFVGFWVAVDWIRITHKKFVLNPSWGLAAGKITLAILMMLYGIFVVKEAVQGKSIAHIVGRVREVSYFAIMITPIVYEVVPLNWVTLIAVVLFFPLFYGIVEFLEYFILPVPGTEISEEEEKKGL